VQQDLLLGISQRKVLAVFSSCYSSTSVPSHFESAVTKWPMTEIYGQSTLEH
jgi:hypothetical protein